MLVWCAEIGEDGACDSDLGFSKWAEKLRGGASGFVQFSNLLMLDRNCLFICASLVVVVDALSSEGGYPERSIRLCICKEISDAKGYCSFSESDSNV